MKNKINVTIVLTVYVEKEADALLEGEECPDCGPRRIKFPMSFK